MTDFRVSIESPQCGYMALALWGGGVSLRYDAAHAPYDSLGDLMRGLAALVRADASLTVKWNAEPEEYDWNFHSDGPQVSLSIVHYPDHRRAPEESRTVFAGQLPARELGHKFEAELRELQARAERDVFASNWRRPFPAAELQALSEALAQYGNARA